MTFLKGETTKKFWISVGKDSRGINGSVIITLSGSNIASYGMQDRKAVFLVSEVSTIKPLMFQRSDILIGSSWISLYLVMNAPCTLYYGIFEINADDRDKGFDIIKAKKIPYDYYTGEYFLGEQVEDISNYNYSLNISGLQSFKEYYLQIFVEGLNGVLSDTPILLNFSTNSIIFLLF